MLLLRRIPVLFMLLMAAPLFAASTCEVDALQNGAILLQSLGGQAVDFRLEKPVPDSATGVVLCWLTEQGALEGKTCADKVTPVNPADFSFGTCKEKDGEAVTTFASPTLDPDDLAKPEVKTLVIRYRPTVAGRQTDVLRVEWTPAEPPAEEPPTPPQTPAPQNPPVEVASAATTGDAEPEIHMYKVSRIAGAARHDLDSRYKLWLYTGYSYFRSQNDFADSYPELRLRFESRLVDERIFIRKYDPTAYGKITSTGVRTCGNSTEVDAAKAAQEAAEKSLAAARQAVRAAQNGAQRRANDASVTAAETTLRAAQEALNVAREELQKSPAKTCRPHFTILRLYGDVGLTGTNVVVLNNGQAGADPLNKLRQTFDGNFGIGFGKIMLVAQETPDHTDAFSIQGLLRLGLTTIPGQDATTADPDGTKGKSAFSYSIGFRVENEGGHFEGAYFEGGWGQSEQFTLKKTPRLRLDGLLPINDPDNLFRIAVRMQLDMPRPFAPAKGEDANKGFNLEGEIRISLLFNIDMRELAHRLGGRPKGEE